MPADLLASDGLAGLFATAGRQEVSLIEFGPAEPELERPEVEAEERDEAHERALQVRVMVDAARAEAAAEARAAMAAECEARVEGERGRVVAMVAQFAELRARWFAKAEDELAQLAVAVARRVMERELRGDPLLLEGAVRAALSRVQDASGIVLRVRPELVADWRGAFAGRADVEVAGDASLAEGDCLVETAVGQVDVGLGTQLGEIAERFTGTAGGGRRVLGKDAASNDARAEAA